MLKARYVYVCLTNIHHYTTCKMRVNKAEITKMPCKIRYASQKRTKERRERERKK